MRFLSQTFTQIHQILFLLFILYTSEKKSILVKPLIMMEIMVGIMMKTWWPARWRRRGGPAGGQGSSGEKDRGEAEGHGAYSSYEILWKSMTMTMIIMTLTLLAFGRQSSIEKTSLAFPSGSLGRNTPTASTSIWWQWWWWLRWCYDGVGDNHEDCWWWQTRWKDDNGKITVR